MSKIAPANGPAADATAAAATDAGSTPSEGAAADAGTPPAKAELTPEQLVEKNRKANAEAKSLRDRNKLLEADLAEFNAWKESRKTDEEKAAEKAQALEAENATLKRSILIARVKTEAKLPDELVERLRGDTEEELLADAKALAALIVPPAAEPLAPNPGQRITPVTETSEDPRQKAAKAWITSILS